MGRIWRTSEIAKGRVRRSQRPDSALDGISGMLQIGEGCSCRKSDHIWAGAIQADAKTICTCAWDRGDIADGAADQCSMVWRCCGWECSVILNEVLDGYKL